MRPSHPQLWLEFPANVSDLASWRNAPNCLVRFSNDATCFNFSKSRHFLAPLCRPFFFFFALFLAENAKIAERVSRAAIPMLPCFAVDDEASLKLDEYAAVENENSFSYPEIITIYSRFASSSRSPTITIYEVAAAVRRACDTTCGSRPRPTEWLKFLTTEREHLRRFAHSIRTRTRTPRLPEFHAMTDWF